MTLFRKVTGPSRAGANGSGATGETYPDGRYRAATRTSARETRNVRARRPPASCSARPQEPWTAGESAALSAAGRRDARREQVEERVVVDRQRARQPGVSVQVADPRHDRGAADRAPGLVPLEVAAAVRPLSDSYCAIVPSRSGKPARCWPSSDRVVDSIVVNHATSCSGAPIDVMSQSSTARGCEVVAEDHVAEPDVAPEQHGLGLALRAGARGTTRARRRAREPARRRSTSRGSRPRSRARPRCRVAGTPAAAPRSARCVAATAADERLVHLRALRAPASDTSHGSRAATSPMMWPRTRGITTNGAPSHCGSVTSSGDAIGNAGGRGGPLRDRLLARGRSRGTCRPSAARAARRTRASCSPSVTVASAHARSTSTVSLEYPMDGCSALTTRTSRTPVRVGDPARERGRRRPGDHDGSGAPCRTSRVQLHS